MAVSGVPGGWAAPGAPALDPWAGTAVRGAPRREGRGEFGRGGEREGAETVRGIASSAPLGVPQLPVALWRVQTPGLPTIRRPNIATRPPAHEVLLVKNSN